MLLATLTAFICGAACAARSVAVAIGGAHAVTGMRSGRGMARRLFWRVCAPDYSRDSVCQIILAYVCQIILVYCSDYHHV